MNIFSIYKNVNLSETKDVSLIFTFHYQPTEHKPPCAAVWHRHDYSAYLHFHSDLQHHFCIVCLSWGSNMLWFYSLSMIWLGLAERSVQLNSHEVFSCKTALTKTGSARPLVSFWTSPISLFRTFLFPFLMAWTYRVAQQTQYISNMQKNKNTFEFECEPSPHQDASPPPPGRSYAAVRCH